MIPKSQSFLLEQLRLRSQVFLLKDLISNSRNVPTRNFEIKISHFPIEGFDCKNLNFPTYKMRLRSQTFLLEDLILKLHMFLLEDLKSWFLLNLMFQMFIFTNPSTPETTHVYVDNSHVNLWSANAKTFVYNFFKVLKRDKKQSHQPVIRHSGVKLLTHDGIKRRRSWEKFGAEEPDSSEIAPLPGPNSDEPQIGNHQNNAGTANFLRLQVWVLSKFDETLTFKSLSFIKVWSNFDF